jgi:hypothetical protein
MQRTLVQHYKYLRTVLIGCSHNTGWKLKCSPLEIDSKRQEYEPTYIVVAGSLGTGRCSKMEH